ncbi:guanine nucleotide-binding protein subunit alpha-15-like isoform X2 [Spea bombifrons]|nr:guanine nucleotide-binding protein subunit alpha-15-like isoform X2 [Spea bombifrons]XP_053321412.1 guanine nucleotide-binding protein subunit alpha-15-like isoform X2 [Spea bombifrons]
MRIIHGAGFSEEDRKMYARLVHQNIVTCAQSLVGAMEHLQIPYTRQENKVNGNLIQELNAYKVNTLSKEHATAIKKIWADPGIKQCYDRRREYHLLDSAKYFMSNLERLTSDGYLPTDEDIVRIRMPTTGIREYCFIVDKCNLRIVDVGGQRGERTKWIHSFQNVYAIIYLASLSEYDQQLEESKNANRMVESMALFHTILKLPWFMETPIILFLNKTDLLAEKIGMSDLTTYFPEYKGPRNDAEAAKEFILETYKNIFNEAQPPYVKKHKKEAKTRLYHHLTCATDTNNIRTVFNDIKEHVLRTYLEDLGLV